MYLKFLNIDNKWLVNLNYMTDCCIDYIDNKYYQLKASFVGDSPEEQGIWELFCSDNREDVEKIYQRIVAFLSDNVNNVLFLKSK